MSEQRTRFVSKVYAEGFFIMLTLAFEKTVQSKPLPPKMT